MAYIEFVILITGIVKVATIGIISAALVSVIKILADAKTAKWKFGQAYFENGDCGCEFCDADEHKLLNKE